MSKTTQLSDFGKLLNYFVPAPGSKIYEKKSRKITRVFAKISPTVAFLLSLLLVLSGSFLGIIMTLVSWVLLIKLFFIAWGIKKVDRDPSILYAFSFLVPIGMLCIHAVQMFLFYMFTRGW